MTGRKEISNQLLMEIEELQILLGDLTEFDDVMFNFLLKVNCSK